MYSYSLAFLTIPDAKPLEAIEVAAKTGYQSIGLRLLPVTKDELSYPLYSDDKLLKDVQLALLANNITLSDLELIWLKSDTDISSYQPFFERAGDLGAKYITTIIDDINFNRCIQKFGQLCEMAYQYKLILNLEPIPWTTLPSLAEAYKIITAISQPNAGLLLDSLHFYRAGHKLSDLTDDMIQHINVFQISDAPHNFDPDPPSIRNFARTSRMLPGEGDLDLKSLVYRMPKNIIISPEVPNTLMIENFSIYDRALKAIQASKLICENIIHG